MENEEGSSNKKPKFDEVPNVSNVFSIGDLQPPIDTDSIKELTEKITQLGLKIQEKQQNLAETRQKLEIGTALTQNLSSITKEFDQFVGLILNQVDSIQDQNDQNIQIEEVNLNKLLEQSRENEETELLTAAKTGNLDEIRRLLGEQPEPPQLLSILFGAFQNGHDELVEYMVNERDALKKGNANLQEFCYFYSQLRDQDLMQKCRKCLKIILNAID
ncbi:hypothetical protein M3Y97_00705000 [Aphelenchoides bicaudatus]|nr:hypothetical protein M3Y97_00705000 [Aphelenchoides bicaudatus]